MAYPIDSFEYHLSKAIPQVYTEDMSYSELLNRVITKLNEVITSSNDYFDKDLKEYTTEILTGWRDDGTLADIINTAIYDNKLEVTTFNDYTATTDNRLLELDRISPIVDDNVTRISALEGDVDSSVHVDDFASIQAAIDFANTNNVPVVEFGAKVYDITTVIYLPSYIELCLHPETILRRMSNNNVMLINDSDGTIGGYGANTNIKIKGGTIDGNKTVYTTACTMVAFGHAENIVLEGVTLTNNESWHMLELNACKNVKVRDCIFSDYGANDEDGEMLQLDIAISATQFPWFAPYDNTPCENILIESCEFKNGVTGIGSHSAVNGVFHKDVIIRGNTFNTFSRDGVRAMTYNSLKVIENFFEGCYRAIRATNIDDASELCTDLNIISNTILNCTERGIQIANYTRVFISKNKVDTVTNRHGIGFDFCSGVTCTENTVTGCGQTGIWSYGSHNVVIANNPFVYSNNVANVSGRFDICVGNYGTSVENTVKTIVTGNSFGTLGIGYTRDTILTGNVIQSGVTESFTNSDLMSRNNIILGTVQA